MLAGILANSSIKDGTQCTKKYFEMAFLVEGNGQIDIKTKFGYKQYRLKIVEEKKSVMTKE